MTRLAHAYQLGIDAAFAKFGNCGSEVRLQIPRRKFHGYDEGWREAARVGEGTKKADDAPNPLEPQGAPHIPAEQLAAMLQSLDAPPSVQRADATRDPLDRSTMWGGATNLNARENAVGLNSSLGQDTSIGTAF